MLYLCLLLQSGSREVDEWAGQLDAEAIEVREDANRKLKAAGSAARPALERAARGTGEGALRARSILLWLNYEGVFPPVVLAHLPGARDALSNGDVELRRRTLLETIPKILGNSGEGVLRAALGELDPALRLQAAFVLKAHGGERSEEIAIDFLRRWDHPDFDRVRGKEFKDLLDWAVPSASRTGRRVAKDVLPLLEACDERVRLAGVWMASEVRCREALVPARALLRDESSEVASAALYFLGRMGALDLETCLEVARRRSDGTACTAVWNLADFKSRQPVPELLRSIEEDPQRDYSSGRLRVVEELDFEAALRASPEILHRFLKDKRIPPALASQAVRILGGRPGTVRFDDLLAALRKLREEDESMQWLFSFAGEDFFAGLAASVPRDRIGEVVSFWQACDQAWMARFRDPWVRLWGIVLDWLDGGEVAEACAKRILDPFLKEDQRRDAAKLLGWSVAHLRPEGVSALIDLFEDERTPASLRSALVGALPWEVPGPAKERLRAIAVRLLKGPADPLRPELLRALCRREGAPCALLIRALREDDTLPFPKRDLESEQTCVPLGEGAHELVVHRLKSPVPEVVRSALRAEWTLAVDPARIDMVPLLGSARAEIREAAAARIAGSPRELHRAAIRRLLQKEEVDRVMAYGLQAALKLRDRESLDVALRRDLVEGGWAEPLRIRAVLELGTREELLEIEGRLRDLPSDLIREALPAIGRKDAAAARRHVGWALAHEEPALRAGGAAAAGAARLEEWLPALRAMLLSEAREVREEAARALSEFGREVSLPAFREALRVAPTDALAELIARDALVELAPEVVLLNEPLQARAAAVWTHALDASVNREDYRRWADLVVPEGFAMTPGGLAAWLTDRGTPTALSAAASELGDCWVGYGGSRRAGEVLRSLRWQDDRPYRTIEYTHVSGPGGLTIMTVDDARDYWRARIAGPARKAP